MKVFYYNFNHTDIFEGWIVLWDGENTYWTEEMEPSSGYKYRPDKRKRLVGFFKYIGEL